MTTLVDTARTRYDATAMMLHWLIALGVILNIAIGLYMGDLPHTDPMKFALVSGHKSLGLTILVLSVIRVIWRLTHRVPPLPEGMGALLALAARLVHFLLYALTILVPLAGWLMVSASPKPLVFFGLFEWPKFSFYAGMAAAQAHRLGEDVFGTAHSFLAWSMLVLVTAHIAAALYHRAILRDGVAERMLPGV